MINIPSPQSLFSEQHSFAIRIWHWCTFLFISVSLITVLLASTIFTVKENVPLVQEELQKKGIIISPEQAKGVAHEYNDKLWMVHKYTGYVLCFLLISRMLIEAFLSKEEKLKYKFTEILKHRGRPTTVADRTHYLLVKSGYLFFFVILLVMSVTGLGLAYEDIPFLKAMHKTLIRVHSFAQYLMYFYILVHLIGVVRAELTGNPGIVSGMIHGNKA